MKNNEREEETPKQPDKMAPKKPTQEELNKKEEFPKQPDADEEKKTKGNQSHH